MFWVQLILVLLCILVGARLGGIGLGVMGGAGLAVMTFVFQVPLASPPIDVMLMIVAVVTAAASMQAAGGLDFLVWIAERILRRNPRHITFLAPAVTYLFTLLAGTGHVAYSVLPVIAEVARRTGIRPERPISVSVIASQVGIVACPISAATVTLLGLLSGQGITLLDILSYTIPTTIIGLAAAAFVCNRTGKELNQEPRYLEKLKDPEFKSRLEHEHSADRHNAVTKEARRSVYLFLSASALVVMMGAFPSLRPVFEIDGNLLPMEMAHTIEIVMLSCAALILLTCKVNPNDAVENSVFMSGMRAVIAIFGIAWMGNTFFSGHSVFLQEGIQTIVQHYPWTFAIALFVLSVMVNSQGAATIGLMPLGITLGIPPLVLIAMFPAVNGYFFIPNYGPIIAAIDFDITGSTRIGKYVINHSFMLPGLITLTVAVSVGLLFTTL